MNFVSPVFLYGLSAIAIPIIIHLIELRRARKILFTNVSFLRDVKNITSSHRRLKHLLILLTRIGFILSSVLAFAQPFIPRQNQVVSNRNVKVYVDNSYSLENESEQAGKNLLNISIDHARNLVNTLNTNTNYNLLDNTNQSSVYADYTAVKSRDRLEQIKFAAVNKPSDLIFSNFRINNNQSFDGFYYSDFQKWNFNPESVKNLGEDNNYYLVHLKGEARHNAFVDSIYLEDEFVRVNQINKLRVRVRNSGENNIESCPVKFYIGNQQISALNIQILAQQATTFVLNYRLSDAELKQCRIVLQDAPIEFDNTYYFTLQAALPISILEVAETRNTPINRLYTNEPLFQFQQVPPGQFNYTMINNTNLIILNGLSQTTPAFADNLREYVEAGGNIAFIPSKPTLTTAYSQFFQRLGLAFVQNVSTSVSQTELAVPDPNNPFFRNIFESRVTKIVMPKASRTLYWQQASADILKFRNGAKFLSRFRKGKGNIYVFAAPLQEEYTDFASHALFVPIMYKLAMQSYKREQNLAYTFGNAVIQYHIKGANQKEIFKLVKESVSFIPEQRVRNGIAYINIPDEISEAGFYALYSDQKKLTEYAFNYDKKESELDTYSVTDLKEMTGNAKNIKVLEASDEVAIKKLFSQKEFGTQLWKYCLILCLIFILTEILLIRFM